MVKYKVTIDAMVQLADGTEVDFGPLVQETQLPVRLHPEVVESLVATKLVEHWEAKGAQLVATVKAEELTDSAQLIATVTAEELTDGEEETESS